MYESIFLWSVIGGVASYFATIIISSVLQEKKKISYKILKSIKKISDYVMFIFINIISFLNNFLAEKRFFSTNMFIWLFAIYLLVFLFGEFNKNNNLTKYISNLERMNVKKMKLNKIFNIQHQNFELDGKKDFQSQQFYRLKGAKGFGIYIIENGKKEYYSLTLRNEKFYSQQYRYFYERLNYLEKIESIDKLMNIEISYPKNVDLFKYYNFFIFEEIKENKREPKYEYSNETYQITTKVTKIINYFYIAFYLYLLLISFVGLDELGIIDWF